MEKTTDIIKKLLGRRSALLGDEKRLLIDSLLPLPAIGQKVTLADNYEFDPQEVIPRGETGVVTFVDANLPPRIGVKMDRHFPSLDDHEGCIWFYDIGGGYDSGTHMNGFTWGIVLEFHRVCRYYLPPNPAT